MSIKVCSFCNSQGESGIVYWPSEDGSACMCSECSLVHAKTTLDILNGTYENIYKPKEGSNKCSFCYTEETDRVYRHNDVGSACMCGNCCLQFARAILEKREQEGDVDSDEDTSSDDNGGPKTEGKSMWGKFNQVLNLGEEWVSEDGTGEFLFETGTNISASFEQIEDMDELEGVLDIFEDATDDEKIALKESLENEGYVSKFSFTVTTIDGEEFYFHQLTGGGGEPVVEDFYCEEELTNTIGSALDEIIKQGTAPSSC